jgi:hypothetical protein
MHSKIMLGLLLFLQVELKAQSQYLVFRVEKKERNKNILNDFWIASYVYGTRIDNGNVIPLFIDGFSKSDYDECLGDSLTVFNLSKEENFEFTQTFLQELNNLQTLVETKGFFFQRVVRKWPHKKNNIRVFVVPIKGEFIFCQIHHADGKAKERLGYEGLVAMPKDKFTISQNFNYKDIAETIDFSLMPWVGLHLLQDEAILQK